MIFVAFMAEDRTATEGYWLAATTMPIGEHGDSFVAYGDTYEEAVADLKYQIQDFLHEPTMMVRDHEEEARLLVIPWEEA